MLRRNALMLTALALIWGASFMFIKVAVRELAPATLIFGRIGLAAIVLAVTAPRGTVAALREHAGWLVAVGLLNTAIPFWLLSWGETRIQSGLASIIQAAVPIFNAGLALIWGASFMFIKVAVRELAPATLIFGRIGLAAIVLAVTAPRGTVAALREHARWLVAVGLLNTAIPFWLLSWGETRIQSGLASIIQAAVPIFNAGLAFLFFRELRVTGVRLVGVAVGFVGVALLVGAQPQGKILGAVAVVGMAFCYGAGGLVASRHLRAVPAHAVALGTSAVAALAAAPFGIAQAPHHVPAWKTIGSVAVLGVVGTAIAYLLFFALISSAGSGYASLVTYLVPPIALAYGAVFLNERFGASAFAALAIILAGVALGSGALRLTRKRSLASET